MRKVNGLFEDGASFLLSLLHYALIFRLATKGLRLPNPLSPHINHDNALKHRRLPRYVMYLRRQY